VTTVATARAHHGGAVASLADTAGAVAAWNGHDFGRGTRIVTLSMTVQHMSASPGSDLLAEAWCSRRGRDVVFVTARVTDPEGRSVAEAMAVFGVKPCR
jgi:uncharacterized protein (TIGR00369 family)